MEREKEGEETGKEKRGETERERENPSYPLGGKLLLKSY